MTHQSLQGVGRQLIGVHGGEGEARVSLPQSFANSTLIIEQINDTEFRIHKAQVIPEDEIHFPEESSTTLSDRDLFLSLLDNPPRANHNLKKAPRKQKGYN